MVILGNGNVARELVSKIERHPELMLQVVGFLYPGVPFLKTGAMLTNFHLPRTSLLLLVCAFAGKDLVLSAYRHAVESAYEACARSSLVFQTG